MFEFVVSLECKHINGSICDICHDGCSLKIKYTINELLSDLFDLVFRLLNLFAIDLEQHFHYRVNGKKKHEVELNAYYYNNIMFHSLNMIEDSINILVFERIKIRSYKLNHDVNINTYD